MNPHSFFADSDPAVLFNADPDPAAFFNVDGSNLLIFKIKLQMLPIFLHVFVFFLKIFPSGSGFLIFLYNRGQDS